VRCPVDINTGALIKSLRVEALEHGVGGYGATPGAGQTAGAKIAGWLGRNFGLVNSSAWLRAASFLSV
jgi:hypothetical protein